MLMNDKLKQALEELRDELRRLGPENPDLLTLQQKTARALESGEHLPIVDELQKTAKTFEVRHPDLTALINQVLNVLSGLGI
jgi:acetylornithine deacetylase/succinyl-diaminopimelate desuccinylase-like protein